MKDVSGLGGSLTALATPFEGDGGAVDYDALGRLVERQIEEGTSGLVPCGTTGESPTLTYEEHIKVVGAVSEASSGRAYVLAGTGSNNTSEAIELSRAAEAAGADGVLLAAPYYNRPSQEGLARHYEAVHAATKEAAVVVYNIPSRSVVDISVETMSRLSRLERIVGLKDASGDVSRAGDYREACEDGFVLLSGEDGSALGYMAHGGAGCISVTSNVAAGLCAKFQAACLRGDYAEALERNDGLHELHRAMFYEPSPAPVKYGLSLLGLGGSSVRAPLVELSEGGRERVRGAMERAGLL